MTSSKARLVLVATACVAILGIGAFAIYGTEQRDEQPAVTEEQTSSPSQSRTIGTSVQGRPIEVYTFGTGSTHLAFIGGVHGGYEWNSVLLAYQFIDYLREHPEFVPASLTIDVVPSANPDGLYRVTGKETRFSVQDVSTDTDVLASGRFNAHEVDLNRNFDCKWQPESTWRSKKVDAGAEPFSEPEAQAIRDFVLDVRPQAVVFWHSQAGAVYASECKAGILKETRAIMEAYARASGYSAIDSFDSYAVTGDAEGWLASIGIPAVTVELTTHNDVEWEKNLAGVTALLEYYSH